MKVLIPAMEKRSALAAARSLGRKGIEVIGCSHTKFNAGFYSKYCHKKYLYCSPFLDTKAYLSDIKKIIEKEKPDVFLPINEETLLPILQEREYFEQRIKLPLPSNEILEISFDKPASIKIAERLNIPCPKTVDMNSPEINFPLIARPNKSRRIEGNRVMADKLFYLKNQKDLSKFDPKNFFLQEYSPGQGFGFYALFDQGIPKAYFMLKRIHEVPFTGGPSSLRESIYEEKLKEYGLKILEELKWHGVAMVEFRKDARDGEFKFIEINGRFWGSLALSIYAGVDFPYLLFKLALGEEIGENFDYKLGIRCRWFFGDVSYLWSVLFGKKIDWRPSRIKTFLEFLKFFDKNLYYDEFLKEDLKPALMETLFSFGKILNKLKKINQ